MVSTETDSCDGDDCKDEEISHAHEGAASSQSQSDVSTKEVALYKCSQCDKTFSKSINLQYHTYRHTGAFVSRSSVGLSWSFQAARNTRKHKHHSVEVLMTWTKLQLCVDLELCVCFTNRRVSVHLRLWQKVHQPTALQAPSKLVHSR